MQRLPERMTETEELARPTDDAVDAALVARWQGGDEGAASALVARHAAAIARFVASLGERAEVDELVQDTFVRAFHALDGFRGESSLRTWLFTIARRLVVDRRRTGARRRAREVDEPGADLATEHTALDAVLADETEGRVRRALASLSPLQREVFVLRVTEGRSYRDIATIANTTEGAARVHYHHAVRAIKEQLDD